MKLRRVFWGFLLGVNVAMLLLVGMITNHVQLLPLSTSMLCAAMLWIDR